MTDNNDKNPADDVLLVERDGHVETWTMNLPEIRNPISAPDVIEALVDNVARVNHDHEVRAVILTGAGPAFSAGGNVKDMVDRNGMFGGSPYELRDGYRNGIQRIPLALYHCQVPVIAAVNGPAVGAGCDLTMMCDMRVASEKAWFAESFVGLGIIPGDGGAWLLTKTVGPARAAEMALTGDRVTADVALEWGLVNEVVAPEELMAAARKLAGRVRGRHLRALRIRGGHSGPDGGDQQDPDAVPRRGAAEGTGAPAGAVGGHAGAGPSHGRSP